MHQKGPGAALFIREGSRVCLEGYQGFSWNKVDTFVTSDKVVLLYICSCYYPQSAKIIPMIIMSVM
jgi:hypothetical protein